MSIIQTVVVVVNSSKAIYTCLAPSTGNYDGAVVSGFFIAPPITVLRTLVRLHPEGAEEKGTRYATVWLMMVDA